MSRGRTRVGPSRIPRARGKRRLIMVSNWKRHANRRNALHSTGPRSPRGKKVSSHNATSHGMFCHAMVLNGEDAKLFRCLREQQLCDHKPQTLSELMLVDRIVATSWKLRRLQEAEALIHGNKSDELCALTQKTFADALEAAGLDDGDAPTKAELRKLDPRDRATL